MDYFRKTGEDLSPFVDALNGTGSGSRTIGGDEFKNVFEPALGLLGPSYFSHVRIRWPISSFEMVRFASESESPRSTIT